MGLFNRGLTMACFWLDGNTPSTNDALQMLAIAQDSTVYRRLTSQVGTGPDEHCLSGEPMMIFETRPRMVLLAGRHQKPASHVVGSTPQASFAYCYGWYRPYSGSDSRNRLLHLWMWMMVSVASVDR